LAEHQIPRGREVIDWFVRLGESLDYHPRREWEVPDPLGATFVDLAWLRRPHDKIPRFIFEVESKAGSQLAENAQKVLSVPTSHFPKPLFFFHVVVKSGGGRPGRAARAHGTANYDIYRLDEDDDGNRLIEEIFRQHARVATELDPLRTFRTLVAPGGPEFDPRRGYRVLEAEGPEVLWERAYLELALEERVFDSELLRVLEPRLETPTGTGSRYESYWGSYWGTALELSLLASLEPPRADEAFRALQVWQESAFESGTMKAIWPYYGLSRDYDIFILFYAPYLWALLASQLYPAKGAVSWIGEQMREVLHTNISRGASARTAAWLLHLAWVFDLDDLWEAACFHVNEWGGLARSLLQDPGFNGPEPDDNATWVEWEAENEKDQVIVDRDSFASELSRCLGLPLIEPRDLVAQLMLDDYPGCESARFLRDWLHSLNPPL
jgi:hypothetical protein